MLPLPYRRLRVCVLPAGSQKERSDIESQVSTHHLPNPQYVRKLRPPPSFTLDNPGLFRCENPLQQQQTARREASQQRGKAGVSRTGRTGPGAGKGKGGRVGGGDSDDSDADRSVAAGSATANERVRSLEATVSEVSCLLTAW